MSQIIDNNSPVGSHYSLLHISSSIGEEEKIKKILDQLTQINKQHKQNTQNTQNLFLNQQKDLNNSQQNGQNNSSNGKKQTIFIGVKGKNEDGKVTSSLFFDDSKLLDHRGNSPLFWACHFGQNDTVNLLIKDYHMPMNRQNFDGDTPLAVGVKSGSYDVVCTLLDCGANPNIPNIRAETPLHVAACFGYGDICKELIKFGGWIDAEDDCGDTPLHWAVREEQVELVGILLSLGADPYHENEDNESPLNLAESVGSESIISVFDSIAGTKSTKETEIDGEAFDITFMNSNDYRVSKGGFDESSNTMDVDLTNSDDSIHTVEIDVNSSGTVHPSSFGKEDEYFFMAGGEEKKIREDKRQNGEGKDLLQKKQDIPLYRRDTRVRHT